LLHLDGVHIIYYNASLHAKCLLFLFILTKSGCSQQILVKIPNINFHKSPSSCSQAVPCGQTHITFSNSFVNTPKNYERKFLSNCDTFSHLNF